jgi:hypothetical protein
MSDPARTISQFPGTDTAVELRDMGVTALRFWRRTLVWIFAVATVCTAVVFATGSEPDMQGFFIGLLITVALFPPAVSAGLEAGSQWDSSRVGVLLLSASLVSFVLVIANGYWLPYLNRGGPDDMPRYSLEGSDRIGSYTTRMFTQPELLHLRDELEAGRQAVRNERRSLDTNLTRRPRPEPEVWRQEMRVLEMRSTNYRADIAWVTWIHQLRTALGLLPLFSVGLGFMIGRWATLLRPGIPRRLFTWSATIPLLGGTGYALATSTEYSRAIPAWEEVASSAFAHLLVIPTVLLIALVCLWKVVRPRLRANTG